MEDADQNCTVLAPRPAATVVSEIEKYQKLYEIRQERRKKKAINVQPLYYDRMLKRDLVNKYPVFVYKCSYPKPKKHDSCQHLGQFTIDRDILTKNEHISFLAQPKPDFGKPPKPPQCFVQRRFLPNCTTRIESLASPKRIRLEHNWQEYKDVLSIRQITNIRQKLQKPLVPHSSIETAICYIQEERRLKAQVQSMAAKKCNMIKRKVLQMERKHIRKIVKALYEVMKEFLVNDTFVVDSPELNNLTRVLQSRISQFCGLDQSSTSHVRQLITTVSQNLAIWIDKFTMNCGIRRLPVPKSCLDAQEPQTPPKDDEVLLPVDDFIPYQSPEPSITQEEFNEYEAE